MSERRKPFLTVRMRSGPSKTPMRVEMFKADIFGVPGMCDVLGNPVPDYQKDEYVRIRINGKWFPAKTRTIYTRDQGFRVLEQLAQGMTDEGERRTGFEGSQTRMGESGRSVVRDRKEVVEDDGDALASVA